MYVPQNTRSNKALMHLYTISVDTIFWGYCLFFGLACAS